MKFIVRWLPWLIEQIVFLPAIVLGFLYAFIRVHFLTGRNLGNKLGMWTNRP